MAALVSPSLRFTTTLAFSVSRALGEKIRRIIIILICARAEYRGRGPIAQPNFHINIYYKR